MLYSWQNMLWACYGHILGILHHGPACYLLVTSPLGTCSPPLASSVARSARNCSWNAARRATPAPVYASAPPLSSRTQRATCQ